MAKKSFFKWFKKRVKRHYAELRALYSLEAAHPTARFEDNIHITTPERLHLGEHVYISRNCILDCGGEKWCDFHGKITLGDHVHIGPNCLLNGSGEIEMGPRARLAAGVMLLSQRMTMKFIDDPAVLDSFAPEHQFGKIVIEEGAQIGAGTIVTMGVTIGKGAAIAGMCLIKKDVPPNTFVIPRPQLKMISTKSSLIIRK